MASKIKELGERCSHLETKYDKLIEMYNSLLDDTRSGIVPDNPQRTLTQDSIRYPGDILKAAGGASTA